MAVENIMRYTKKISADQWWSNVGKGVVRE